MFALVKESVLSINEKAPITTLLLKSPIISLDSIFCIIGFYLLQYVYLKPLVKLARKM
jgi:hypothetical protein